METGSDVILSIRDVSKSFPGVKALDGVSVEVRRGTVHGLVGENGAGKSTLMKILSGVYEKDAGEVIFDGERIERTTPRESMGRGLAIIYQELDLVNTMSVGENVFLGRFREMKGMRGTHARARQILDSIGCKVSTTALVADLSVSEKQMVEIAKALSFESKLIIMDEPSSSLTGEELVELAKIIRQLKDRGISIIYISHKLAEIFDFCDVVTVMRDGRIIDTKPRSEFTRNELIAKMVGRTIENEYPPRPQSVGAPLMELRSLNTRKLHDISFTLHRGEILGLVGLVGAGRTEIVRALFGADKVRGHQVLIEGKPVAIADPRDAKKAGLGFIPEDRKLQGLVLPFTVESNISMASIRNFSRLGFIRRSLEKSIAARQVKALAIKAPSTRTVVGTLSGGNQQKCIVGRWMEIAPRIFIMDEPTRGIDVGAKYEIYSLMRQIAERGGAIILISSELPEVLNMSNRVLTIFEGRLTGQFDPQKAKPDEIMSAALGMDVELRGEGHGPGAPASWRSQPRGGDRSVVNT
jgi:ribose transport system ATP-binding protein